jgi:hypothetical protein
LPNTRSDSASSSEAPARAAEGHDQQVERRRHLRLGAAERGKAARGQSELQFVEVMAAQRDVMRQIRGTGFRPLGRNAPLAPEFGALRFNVLAKRLHFGQEGAEVVEIFAGPGRHGRLPARKRPDGNRISLRQTGV